MKNVLFIAFLIKPLDLFPFLKKLIQHNDKKQKGFSDISLYGLILYSVC